ncbi:7TM GPCR, serpentine receptor class x (Srx) family-containing protein [Strongyloides ratti]|uniref:7TM GPCR, serpentine receptor class x (Srx) family-containing protein n=1 Tax=Strongyloides ratti TaxID=34506 RepID=A0A090LN28_STRRB|nr:7TM GPCR, serpentine receptor class x (Srx) family-containing protein [Strongyloides ratti]CEF69578.1 7TM GPCR, serpentine receptor class x (Srx) family-containing protein [Strongyloides ratti]
MDSTNNITFINQNLHISSEDKSPNHFQVGIICCVISFFNLIIETLACYSFYKIKHFTKTMSFEIMRHQSHLVIILQLCHFATSFITMFDLEEIFLFNLLVGSLMEFSYVGYVSFILLLSINRFDAMYNNFFFPNISRKKIFSIGIIICYLFGFPIFVFFVIPNNRLVYNGQAYGWTFRQSIRVVLIVARIKGNTILAFLVICFILYILIILKIIQMRCRSKKIRKKSLSLEDFKLLIHTQLCFATIAFVELCWIGIFPFFISTITGTMCVQILFNSITGVNTLFTLIFVKDVFKVLSMCFFKSKTNKNNVPKANKVKPHISVQ